MKISCKINIRQLQRKVERMRRQAERDVDEDLVHFGREFVNRALRFTPPNNGGKSPAEAIAKLRRRIAKDLTGSETAQDRTWQHDDSDFRWIHVGGDLRLVPLIKRKGYPTPFYAVTGKKAASQAAELGAGRYRVQFVESGLGEFMRASGNYYISVNSKGTAHLKFIGPRHFAPAAAITAEVKRRQKQAGRLLAGWRAMAKLSKARLTGCPSRHKGEGSAVKKGSGAAKTVTARNSVPFGELRAILRRESSSIHRAIKKRGHELAQKKRARLRRTK